MIGAGIALLGVAAVATVILTGGFALVVYGTIAGVAVASGGAAVIGDKLKATALGGERAYLGEDYDDFHFPDPKQISKGHEGINAQKTEGRSVTWGLRMQR